MAANIAASVSSIHGDFEACQAAAFPSARRFSSAEVSHRMAANNAASIASMAAELPANHAGTFLFAGRMAAFLTCCYTTAGVASITQSCLENAQMHSLL